MKNVYESMRPSWAKLNDSETRIIFIASFMFVVYGLIQESLTTWLSAHLTFTEVHVLSSLVDLTVFTAGILRLIHIFKRLAIGKYPATFLYFFLIPEESNPSGKSKVVGYCHVQPIESTGEIKVTGASFFLENGRLEAESRCGFTSYQVHGTKEDEETTCHIHFTINAGDRHKRNYERGLLMFRLDLNSGANAVPSTPGADTYAGLLEAEQLDVEGRSIAMRSRGYAEWFRMGKLSEEDVKKALQQGGDNLLNALRSMLLSQPGPTLWEGKEETVPNCWGHQIPKPQLVVLNEDLWPHIDNLLSRILALAGLKESSITKFKRLVRESARINAHFSRVEYERDLKHGLVGLIKPGKINCALYERALIVKRQIEPFLIGDSLLDIGCGNGMITDLVRSRFKRIQLLDVVDYLGERELPFKLYTEGQPLPIEETYDTVLLLTVLHHSRNPEQLLRLAWKATARRLIIIESVVGVTHAVDGVRYDLIDEPIESQIGFAAFVDWFYNRVLHDDVPVPYNFTTPSRWMSLFAASNMSVLENLSLGQDIEIGPEYHTLFVLEKDGNSNAVQPFAGNHTD